MQGRRWIVVPVIGALLLVGAACSNDKGGGGGGNGSVSATEKDFAIALDPSSSSTGSVTFNITNDGPSVHEFVVFKSDLAEDQLPLTSDGTAVDEEGAGVTHIDEVEDVASGGSDTLAVTLQPGKYVVLCNLPGHYKLGMHASFTVSG